MRAIVNRMSAKPGDAAEALPPEHRTRGTLLALLILPAGVLLWAGMALVGGFMAGIVALGVGLGGLWLYRRGSGGRISYDGAARVLAIVVVTLVLAFVAGLMVADFGQDLPITIVLAAVFAVLGGYFIVRTAQIQAAQERGGAAR
jgi:hypothetical protein